MRCGYEVMLSKFFCLWIRLYDEMNVSYCCRAGNLCLFNVSGYAYMTKLTHLSVAVQWSKFLVCLWIQLPGEMNMSACGIGQHLCYFHISGNCYLTKLTPFCGRSTGSVSLCLWKRLIDKMKTSSCSRVRRPMLLPCIWIRLYDEMNTSSCGRVR